MIRVVLLNLLLLFLPTILYFTYVGIMREPNNEPSPDAPLVWLVIAGGVLMVIGLVSFGNW